MDQLAYQLDFDGLEHVFSRQHGRVVEARDVACRAAKREGLAMAERAAAKAQEKAGFDREAAARFILGYLRVHGATPGEELTDQAKQHGHRPQEDRAFGAVFQALVRRGEIECVGFCLRRKGHSCSGGRVWQARQQGGRRL